MKSNPAITPSTRPRSAAEAADSVPRPERRGCGHVASTAARSSAVKGAAGEPPIQGAGGGAVGGGGGGGNRGGREAARGGDGERQCGAFGGVGREGVSHYTWKYRE